MYPTRAMDIRAQVILDSRHLATVAKYFEDRGMIVRSLSDLIRQSIQVIAAQAHDEGYQTIVSKQEAQSILSEYSQRGRGYIAHPSYEMDGPIPDPRFKDSSKPYSLNPNAKPSIPSEDQQKVDALLKQSPKMSRVRAHELVQIMKGVSQNLTLDPSLKARIDALNKSESQ